MALVVIGPKDLPKVLRAVGVFVGKAREMAREFQAGLDDMVRQSELDELRRTVDSATSFDLNREVKSAIDADGSLEKTLDLSHLADPAAPLIPPAPSGSFSPADADPPPAAAAPPPVAPVIAAPAPAAPIPLAGDQKPAA